jgi:hypothetical protein
VQGLKPGEGLVTMKDAKYVELEPEFNGDADLENSLPLAIRSGLCDVRAVMVATNSWLLMNVVTRKEPFQLTTESRWKSLPLTVSRNWLPPAVALLGEIEVMDGAGGQVPQDTTIASASTDMRANLDALAIGLHLRQLADGIES